MPGSGLGLSIVRQVAERHGGSVRVGTAPGGGAAFWFQIPGGVPAVGGPPRVFGRLVASLSAAAQDRSPELEHMTDERHPFPDHDAYRDDSTGPGADPTEHRSARRRPPAATTHGAGRPASVPPPTGAASDAPATRRRTGVLSAAVLAGALVVGGAAGVGGAAAYNAFQPDSSTSGSPDLSASPRTNASSTNNVDLQRPDRGRRLQGAALGGQDQRRPASSEAGSGSGHHPQLRRRDPHQQPRGRGRRRRRHRSRSASTTAPPPRPRSSAPTRSPTSR